ncbi:MAG: ROK family protein [Pseudomonadota bacterium]
MKLGPNDIAVAADVGGTTIRMGVFDSAYKPGDAIAPLQRQSSQTLKTNPIEVLRTAVLSMVPADKRLAAAVIGLPTMFDASTRVVQSSPNIPELEGLDVAEALSEVLEIPVIVDRETVLMALGEWVIGVAKGHSAVLGVFIGTGIGGAMLFDGKPYRGASGAGVEIGHVPIGIEGKQCVCGNIDCLEAYASGHVLVDVAKECGRPIDAIFTEPALAPAIDRYVQALSYGLACAANILDPEILFIGGGLALRDKFPMRRVMDQTRDHLRAPSPRHHMILKPAMLGSQAIIPGARCLLDRL